MTEQEALDEAAKAAGWRDWKALQLIARPDKQDDIRRHARTLMENAALKAENERLFDALFDAIALIGHVVPMNTTALVGGEKLTALNVWQAGHDLMFPKRQARAALKEIEGD